MKINRGKKLFSAVFLVLLAAFVLANVYFFKNPSPSVSPTKDNSPGALTKTGSEKIKIILVGDIMLDRGVEYMVEKKGGGDFKFPFLKIAGELKEADILFGNLEGPLSDKGTNVGGVYSFRMKPEALEGLKYAGFNVLSLANNHALDYGEEALKDTCRRLNKEGIACLGPDNPVIKEVKGTKIAFLAYTSFGFPLREVPLADENNLDEIKKEVESAKEKADIVIVSLHSGNEYSLEPTSFQKEFAKAAIGGGASLVAEHHSHVVQPNEKYKDGYVFYGLGNFIFDQSFSEETMKGLLVEIIVENKKIADVVSKETIINKFFQPAILSPSNSNQ